MATEALSQRSHEHSSTDSNQLASTTTTTTTTSDSIKSTSTLAQCPHDTPVGRPPAPGWAALPTVSRPQIIVYLISGSRPCSRPPRLGVRRPGQGERRAQVLLRYGHCGGRELGPVEIFAASRQRRHRHSRATYSRLFRTPTGAGAKLVELTGAKLAALAGRLKLESSCLARRGWTTVLGRGGNSGLV